MKAIILLDVDGVLNPKVRRGDGNGPDLRLSDMKVALVRRLATKGRIAWVSTPPADVVAALEAQLRSLCRRRRNYAPSRQRGPKRRNILVRFSASGSMTCLGRTCTSGHTTTASRSCWRSRGLMRA